MTRQDTDSLPGYCSPQILKDYSQMGGRMEPSGASTSIFRVSPDLLHVGHEVFRVVRR